jgi:hypothetical protein
MVAFHAFDSLFNKPVWVNGRRINQSAREMERGLRGCSIVHMKASYFEWNKKYLVLGQIVRQTSFHFYILLRFLFRRVDSSLILPGKIVLLFLSFADKFLEMFQAIL